MDYYFCPVGSPRCTLHHQCASGLAFQYEWELQHQCTLLANGELIITSISKAVVYVHLVILRLTQYCGSLLCSSMCQSVSGHSPYPFLRYSQKTVKVRDSKLGVAMVLESTDHSGGFVLGFRIDPYEKMKEMLQEIQSLHQVRQLVIVIYIYLSFFHTYNLFIKLM